MGIKRITDWGDRHSTFLWGIASALAFGQAVARAASHEWLLVGVSSFTALVAIWNAYARIEQRSLERIEQLVDDVSRMHDIVYVQTKLLLKCQAEQREIASRLEDEHQDAQPAQEAEVVDAG